MSLRALQVSFRKGVHPTLTCPLRRLETLVSFPRSFPEAARSIAEPSKSSLIMPPAVLKRVGTRSTAATRKICISASQSCVLLEAGQHSHVGNTASFTAVIQGDCCLTICSVLWWADCILELSVTDPSQWSVEANDQTAQSCLSRKSYNTCTVADELVLNISFSWFRVRER